MSEKHFAEFRCLVLADLDLQKRFQGITEREAIVKSIIELGAEKGLEITAEDVAEAMRQSRRRWHERWI
jgi:EAL domain-containing protein (putative c-di-GMP-specific phosphodiesterase class I)